MDNLEEKITAPGIPCYAVPQEETNDLIHSIRALLDSARYTDHYHNTLADAFQRFEDVRHQFNPVPSEPEVMAHHETIPEIVSNQSQNEV